MFIFSMYNTIGYNATKLCRPPELESETSDLSRIISGDKFGQSWHPDRNISLANFLMFVYFV